MSNTTTIVKTSVDLSPVQDRVVALGVDTEILERESMYAHRLIQADARLQKCDPVSVALAVLDAASLGVTLNPTMNYAYLEGRWDSKQNKNICYFRMMYQGIGYLMIKHGAATSFNVQCVHKKDEFNADLGDQSRPIVHKVAGFDRGPVDGVYAMANLPDGKVIAEMIGREESDRILATSQSPAAKMYPEEFRRKTCLKRLCKRLSKGFDESPLARAIELDNREYTEAVEVPPEPKKLPELTPDHPHWEKVVQRVAQGVADLEKVQDHYEISVENALKLDKQAIAYNLKQD